jgi:hypothetical protein
VEEDDDHDDVMFFVHGWTEAVLRQLERVKEQREKSRIDLRNNERMEEWSPPDEVLYRNFGVQWVEEHMLLWAAYQLERWTRRLATERGEPQPVPDPALAAVRNALEHLDEANFEDGYAVPGRLGRNTSLRSLPGASLAIALGGGGLFVNSIKMDEIEKRAEAALDMANPESYAKEDALVEQYLIDKRRGK